MDPAPSSDPLELSFGSAEALLREVPIVETLGLLRRSSNYTFLVRLGAATDPALAVYKPAAGEAPLWDFPPGSLYRREVAAYRLSRVLGWPLIPPTVVRTEAPQGVGALQLYVDVDPHDHFLRVRGEAPAPYLAVAAFDAIVNNADRKAGHLLRDAHGRIWALDHGLTFHVEPKLRTVIWDYSGQLLPAELRADVERTREALRGDLGAELAGLLTRREVAALERRLRQAAAADWRFPRPTSEWSVPWPPV